MAESGIMIHGRHGFDFEFEPCAFTFDSSPGPSPAMWRAIVKVRLEAGDQPKVIIKTPFGYLLGDAVITNVNFYAGDWESEIRGDRGLTHYREAGDAMEAGGF